MSEEHLKEKELFIKYNYIIYSFEKFIEKIYSNNKEDSSNAKYKGYIIQLKDLEKLIELIDYKKIKSFFHSQMNETQKILKFFDANKFKKISNLKQIEFQTPRYLIYMLMNKESYIIVNEDFSILVENLGKNKNTLIEYTLEKDNQICINFGNGENILLRTNKDNIINEYSYKYGVKKEEYKYFIDENKNIIKDVNSFYNIEKEFLDNLNKKDNNKVKLIILSLYLIVYLIFT